MKRIICNIEYDTETAEPVKQFASGEFGDPAGYEETLYKTEGGKFFLYGNGGEASKYAEPTIRRLSLEKASAWLASQR